MLPEPDEEGRIVIFNQASAKDPSRHTTADIMRCFMLTLETLLLKEEVQIRGLSYIFYCSNLTLAHAMMWTASEAADLFTMGQVIR